MKKLLLLLPLLAFGPSSAQDAVEAGKSCVVVHGEDEDKGKTCFENIALEKSSFESGVCQWKTDAQAEADIGVTTSFVAQCPGGYTGMCDRLVLGDGRIAPVRIFLYDHADEVLARAKRQCVSGGGAWTEGAATEAE